MGVTRVQVLLEKGEVIVTYDPGAVTVDALIMTLDTAEGPFGGAQYKATVKERPRP
jgi:hypothetical protein